MQRQLGEPVNIDASIICWHVELANAYHWRGELAEAERQVPIRAVPQHAQLLAAVAKSANAVATWASSRPGPPSCSRQDKGCRPTARRYLASHHRPTGTSCRQAAPETAPRRLRCCRQDRLLHHWHRGSRRADCRSLPAEQDRSMLGAAPTDRCSVLMVGALKNSWLSVEISLGAALTSGPG